MIIFEIVKVDENKKEVVWLLYEILKFLIVDYCYINIRVKVCCELSRILFKGKNLFKIIEIDREEMEKIIELWCFEKVMRLCFN